MTKAYCCDICGERYDTEELADKESALIFIEGKQNKDILRLFMLPWSRF